MRPTILVHGGAWAIPDEMAEAHKNGVRKALDTGWDVLAKGGTALQAVEEAVVVMEEDDTFDAGYGSFLTRDGRVQIAAQAVKSNRLVHAGDTIIVDIPAPISAIPQPEALDLLREVKSTAFCPISTPSGFNGTVQSFGKAREASSIVTRSKRSCPNAARRSPASSSSR